MLGQTLTPDYQDGETVEFQSETNPDETVSVTLEGQQYVTYDPDGTAIIIDHNEEGCCGDWSSPMQTAEA